MNKLKSIYLEKFDDYDIIYNLIFDDLEDELVEKFDATYDTLLREYGGAEINGIDSPEAILSLLRELEPLITKEEEPLREIYHAIIKSLI